MKKACIEQAFFVRARARLFDHEVLAPSLAPRAFKDDEVRPRTECFCMEEVRL